MTDAERQDATIRICARIVYRLINTAGKPYTRNQMLADAEHLRLAAGIEDDDGAAEMASWS